MSETFDRSALDGKDREQLGEIASALGVKARALLGRMPIRSLAQGGILKLMPYTIEVK